MADVSKLRKQRGYIKGKLTRLQQILGQGQGQAAATLSVEDAEVRLERLSQVNREFHETQQQIFDEIGELSMADVTAEEEFEEGSLVAQAELKRIINLAKTTNIEATTTEKGDVLSQLLQQQMALMEKFGSKAALQDQASNGAPSQNSGIDLGTLLQTQTEILQRFSDDNVDGAVSRNRVKLPTIKLPTFDGKIEEWTKFYDAFTTTINNNSTLPKIQKFIYLRSCVSGAAARAIEDIELSDDNYSVAWEQLQRRFEDSGVIKRKHVQCLFEMPSVGKESASAILNLVDHVNKHTRVLKRLGSPTDSWGDLLLFMVESKLDPTTLRAWEERNNIKGAIASGDADEQQSDFEELMEFLIQRCHALERIESSKCQTHSNGGKDTSKAQGQTRLHGRTNQAKGSATDRVTSLASSMSTGTCFLCNEAHLLYNCSRFLAMNSEERLKTVRQHKLCINCLRKDHFARNCKHGSCRECAGRHNTLLHLPTAEKSAAVNETKGEPGSDVLPKTACHSFGTSRCNVLMATAIVDAESQGGFKFPLRVLLDSGSEANFITQSACKKLGSKRNTVSETVAGVNNIECQVRQVTNVLLKSRCSNFQINAQCLIIPKITRDLPSREIDKEDLNIPSNLRLADFEFNKSNAIDVLLGAEFFFELLDNGKIELGGNKPLLQNTKLGWVIAGPILGHDHKNVCTHQTVNVLHCSVIEDDDLNKTLKQFWEIENVGEDLKSAYSAEETMCENMYVDTTTRNEQGRFVVSLPIKPTTASIGETKSVALKRLAQIERRFKRDKLFHERYVQFMREYLELEHMSLVESCKSQTNKPIVYLPHHGVIKETSLTTKLRVVFDASNKSDTGISLNDILMVGPTLQDNLIYILLRFRFHNIALTGDLEKMYRQILIHPTDRDYQRIVWRFNMENPIQEYVLNTVTYGQASASYLAIRSVRRLAEENKETLPLASKCALNDMYVDDIISGAKDIEEARALREQISALMSKGGFKVHKWHSNKMEILFEDKQYQNEASRVDIKVNDTIRTLGLIWEPNSDVFVSIVNFQAKVQSKRALLSEIGKLFDPLGLLGPIITLSKILMQKTWKENINWDDELPASIINQWNKLRSEFDKPNMFCIPRKVFGKSLSNEFILYGFCDASEDAYGACIYIRARDDEGQARLLCSKSRIAPIKTLSIPRLELSNALLLSRLIDQVRRAYSFKFHKIYAFTDSTVTLYWINGDSSRWKPFVANRIIEITNIISPEMWSHVKSKENPADILSRGALPNALRECNLWWKGPVWISGDTPPPSCQENFSEQFNEKQEVKIEKRKIKGYHSTIVQNSILQNLYLQFSNLNKIERILAYCLRFSFNCRHKSERRIELLCVSEFEAAKLILALQEQRSLKTSSKLVALHPFLDDKTILRVGGRLQHAPLSFTQRHPILLPANHILTRLLVEREHKRLLHSGPQALLASIRRKYWPLRGKDIVRKVCHSCVWCFRKKPRSLSQLMGSLPTDRVTPMRPFYNCGVDFAGPIITLVNKGRGRKTNKSYIALFICFATKAIHLEAVSDLTTEAFLATLRRFIGRRGMPQRIYSDNATNFKGSQREIAEAYTFLRQQVDGPLHNFSITEGLQWIFIPPYSPHFGGLWEAGIKSCKNLLKTITGNSLFTFEELCTALVQVESCLNSRPLYALSNDPSDLEALTPGHFLIGGPITNLPEVDLQDINIHRLNRWQLVQRALQDFWKRWAAEFVSSLQGRSKWKKIQVDLRINDLVILREEHTPPLHWKLGRVTELHQGTDGLVRVASIRTANGVTKRAITKLCKLPVDETKDY